MFYYFLFFFVAFGVSKADESNCGIAPSLERYKIFNPNRIFGGENSNEFDFPWYIWMYADGGGGSGTIIHEKWILTAAHCVNSSSNISVYYGSVDWEIMKTQKVQALRYFIHPEYTNDGYFNDIALVELVEPLNFSANVQPICLDHTVDPYDNEILTQCVKKGYSHFSHYILQDAPIQHHNSSEWGKGKLWVGGINHAGFPGDSGGPLMAIRNNRWVQVGITSTYTWSGFENESLSIHAGNYYMRVSYYCDWIKKTTNNDVNC